MLCPTMGDGTPITCTTTYQKQTGQPIYLAGSKNPTTLVVWSVKSKQEGIKFSPAVGSADKMFMIRYLLTDVAEQNPDILMIELVA